MATNVAKADCRYQLSCEILGHSADVRAVKAIPHKQSKDSLLTASRDGTACVWGAELGSDREYVLKKVIKSHTGYVSALCVIPEDLAAGRDKPLVVTGGQDNTILVHSMEEGMEEPIERYIGHKGLVTCLIYQHNQLISASWDSTVRVWKGMNQSDAIEAHRPAVWAISGLFNFDGTRRILSGGADRIVKLWEVDTKMCVQEYHGHADVVRDVKVTSHETFLSAANDCVIRKWNIHSGQCLREIYGHEAFVYSLALRPNGSDEDFVSCGEDSTVRVWEGGDCKQVIKVPATSVWSVCCLTNGDIAAGSSDGVARVFSADKSRTASAMEITTFNAKVEEHRLASTKSDIDVSKLPGKDALLNPGKSNGDTLMINNDGVPEVYQWNSGEWSKIGNAIGKAPDNSKVYNGKEYDYVFDIELDEGSATKRTLKLPYDRATDPYVAAEDFLSANNLPAYYLDQVAEFILQNAGDYHGSTGTMAADPFTGGSRYVPGSTGASQGQTGSSDPFTGGNRYRPGQSSVTGPSSSAGGAVDPFTGGGSYRPSEFSAGSDEQPQFTVKFQGSKLAKNTFYPMSEFRFFSSPQDYGEKVLGKIREFNEASEQSQPFTNEELTKLQFLCNCFTGDESAITSHGDLQLVERLLEWPPQCVFPGLDILRLALLSKIGHQYFIPDVGTGRLFVEKLLGFAIGTEVQSKNQLLVLRALANIFSKELGVQVMDATRDWVFSQLSLLYPCSTSRPSQIALSTIVLNYSHFYSQAEKLEGYMECTEHICKIIESPFDSEAKFRALISVGSLALVSKDAVKVAAQPKDMNVILRNLIDTTDVDKVKQCAEFVVESMK